MYHIHLTEELLISFKLRMEDLDPGCSMIKDPSASIFDPGVFVKVIHMDRREHRFSQKMKIT